ncbi:poly [ADP-ribose] polymerase 2 [Nymphaea colorata]|nr:poly [ADP-ribose] polymerase 2 [Nymphaea colorata]
MSSKLKVDELRKQLANRGLDTAGNKAALVKRLDAAILEEEKKAALNSKNTGSKKRKADLELDAAEEGAADVENEVASRKKFVTATKKCGAILDQWLPDDVKSHYHVLVLGNEAYDAMLNQTNMGQNNNKYYMIQVLESDDHRSYMVYLRWGRVGVKGQNKLIGPYSSRVDAIKEFESKFHSKTNNCWSSRQQFISFPKYYTWLEMDYSEDADGKDKRKLDMPNISGQLRETKLDPCIAQFISLICDISMMKQQMLEIGYNAEKLPLGKLSKSTIVKGYEVLRRISDVIGSLDKKKLEMLSGEFYTVIPHDFGFKKMSEFVIDTPQKLKQKLEMVEALGEIEVATKLLKDEDEMQDDPLYAHYQRLNCNLEPLEADCQEYSMIKEYMKNTHAKTHADYTVDILQIFKVCREAENERFEKFSRTKNRMLLWHGSRLANWTGILSQGLRIAPPEAPVTGYMFGKGVYFADMFSKSANYCYAYNSGSRSGVLLLCEVALGDMAELLTANYNADQLPFGKLSTKGVGGTAPNPLEFRQLDDGVTVPLGKPVNQKGAKGSLLYNEYVVYNVDQIKMRYVIQVTFDYNK